MSIKHITEIAEALAKVDKLCDIWSVDFILEEDRVWLIDMAIGCRSAYYDANAVEDYKKLNGITDEKDDRLTDCGSYGEKHRSTTLCIVR